MPRRLGVDLGTTNTRVIVPRRGVVINEPTVVAMEIATSKIVAIGEEAKQMLGRTPDSIIAAHPLKDGAIASYRITEAMLRYFLAKAMGRFRLSRPEIMLSVPAGVTSTERRAVIDAALQSGAKQAYVIKEPIAAALGAGVPIATPNGNMIINLGGGTTEIAVIALGDAVAASSVRVGGGGFDQGIQTYIRKKHGLVIGEQTAEEVKIRVGAAVPLEKELQMEVSGSNAISGLPESVIVTSIDIMNGVKEPLSEVIGAVKQVLQKTPPELASDVMDKGILLTGGGALLRGVDKLFTKVTGVPCQVAEEPLMCVVKGTGIAVENLDAYKRSVLWAKA